MFSQRLREERERLGLSTQDIALAGDVSREMWNRYERGVAVPNADVLVRLMSKGLDLNWVLGGDRTFSASVTPEEQELLGSYRGTDDEGRSVVLRAARMELLRVRQTAPGGYPPQAVRAPLVLQEPPPPPPTAKPRRKARD